MRCMFLWQILFDIDNPRTSKLAAAKLILEHSADEILDDDEDELDAEIVELVAQLRARG